MYKKKIGYIANKKEMSTTENGRQKMSYDKPIQFHERYMPVSEDNNTLEEYGTDINKILVMYVKTKEWYGKINEEDRAYLVDINTNEKDLEKLVSNASQFCTNANYKVLTATVQNLFIKVVFKKID